LSVTNNLGANPCSFRSLRMSRSAARLSSRRRCTSTSRTSPTWSTRERKSGSHRTLRWREMDSNFRSPVRRTAFSRLPVRITRPSCYADERSAEHRTPAGAGELGGRAKEPVSVKGELRGIERGPQKVVSLWVRIHGAALLKPEFTPDAEGARPQRSAQDASLWSSKPLFRSHRNG
jgi:hypothetical protein